MSKLPALVVLVTMLPIAAPRAEDPDGWGTEQCGQAASHLAGRLLGKPCPKEVVTVALGSERLSVADVEQYFDRMGCDVEAWSVGPGSFRSLVAKLADGSFGRRSVGIMLIGALPARVGHYLVLHSNADGDAVMVDPLTLHSERTPASALSAIALPSIPFLLVTAWPSALHRFGHTMMWWCFPVAAASLVLVYVTRSSGKACRIHRRRHLAAVGGLSLAVFVITELPSALVSRLPSYDSAAERTRFSNSVPSADESTLVDLGDCPVGVAASFRFAFRNTSDHDWLIENLRPSCTCIELGGRPTEVAAHEQLEVAGTITLGSAGPFQYKLHADVVDTTSDRRFPLVVIVKGVGQSSILLESSSRLVRVKHAAPAEDYVESFPIPASAGEQSIRFMHVSWPREEFPFTKFWIENDDERWSRLFVSVAHDAPPDTDIEVILTAEHRPETLSPLSVRILNQSQPRVFPARAGLRPDGSVRLWVILPGSNDSTRFRAAVAGAVASESGSTSLECGIVSRRVNDDGIRVIEVAFEMPVMSDHDPHREVVVRILDERNAVIGDAVVWRD